MRKFTRSMRKRSSRQRKNKKEKHLTGAENYSTISPVVKRPGFTNTGMEGISVANKAFRMTMLFDFYGDLLTERQKEFLDLYYNEDLSLAEIAENAGITRQGVRDVLMRSEAILTELEQKTGIVARFLEMQKISTAIDNAAREILLINEERYNSSDLMRLAQEIRSCAEQLKE